MSTDPTDPFSYEPHPDLKKHFPFAPNPADSLTLPVARQDLLSDILALYCGRPSESALRRYAPRAVFEDPFALCDTRYKIATSSVPTGSCPGPPPPEPSSRDGGPSPDPYV